MILKYLLYVITSIVLILLVLLFRPVWTPQIDHPNSISSLEDIVIGGVSQSILVRGNDTDLPILLFIHGGPGGAMSPVAHVFGEGLEEHFVVVHWDQRGAGRSARYVVPNESLNLEQHLADTRELIEVLRVRFNVNKVYLLGHSWGSVLGLMIADRYPELLHAYIGMAQATNQKRSEKLSLRFARRIAESTGNRQAQFELATLEPPYLDKPSDIDVQRKWLSKFGGSVHDGKPFLFWPDIDRTWATSALVSPEYSWLDLFRYLQAIPRLRWALFQEFKQVDFMTSIPRIEVPVYFLMGRHDYNMNPKLVEEYYHMLEASKGKSLIWFEHSAHVVCLEEPIRFIEVMTKRVLSETAANHTNT